MLSYHDRGPMGYFKSQFSKIFQGIRALIGQKLTKKPISPKVPPLEYPKKGLVVGAILVTLPNVSCDEPAMKGRGQQMPSAGLIT